MREHFPEKPELAQEYNYEEGLHAVLKHIEELLLTEDLVFVNIGGPSFLDTNVGKTTFSGALAVKLGEMGVPVVYGSDLESLKRLYLLHNLRTRQINSGSRKGVLILGAMDMPPNGLSDEGVERWKNFKWSFFKKYSNDVGMSSPTFVEVLIQRPESPKADEGIRSIVDFVIYNEKATLKEPIWHY